MLGLILLWAFAIMLAGALVVRTPVASLSRSVVTSVGLDSSPVEHVGASGGPQGSSQPDGARPMSLDTAWRTMRATLVGLGLAGRAPVRRGGCRGVCLGVPARLW